MTELKTGDIAPDFTAVTDGNTEISLSALKGKNVILYFYPKDDTPGCTAEACDFRDNMNSLAAYGAVVIGVSKDSVSKHAKFKGKYNLNFPLIADENGKVCEAYGTWTEKSLYGRKYMGIERATYLIGPDGKILKIWRKVKVKGHIAEIIETLKSLGKAA